MLKHYEKDMFDVHSAGVKPSYVHPLAIKAMAESGINIANRYPKTVNEFLTFNW